MSEDEWTRFDTLGWCLHVIHCVVVVIAAQSFHFVLPLVAEFHIDTCAFIPFHLQLEWYYFDHDEYARLVDVKGALAFSVAYVAKFCEQKRGAEGRDYLLFEKIYKSA